MPSSPLWTNSRWLAMLGNVLTTSLLASGRPAPPPPVAPWHDAHLPEKIVAPPASCVTSLDGAADSDCAYSTPQMGRKAMTGSAHTGTFARRSAARTYGGTNTGFGGSAGTTGAAARAGAACAAGVTSVEDVAPA